MALLHFGDPCIHCDTAQDEVASGPCPGDPTKAVPISYRALGIRHDGFQKFRIEMSNGDMTTRFAHLSENLEFGYLRGIRYNSRLAQNGN
jgi:hypothetical protein